MKQYLLKSRIFSGLPDPNSDFTYQEAETRESIGAIQMSSSKCGMTPKLSKYWLNKETKPAEDGSHLHFPTRLFSVHRKPVLLMLSCSTLRYLLSEMKFQCMINFRGNSVKAEENPKRRTAVRLDKLVPQFC